MQKLYVIDRIMLFGVISLKIFGKHNSELPQTNQQLTSNDESSFSSGDAPYFLTYYTSQWIEEFYLSHRILLSLKKFMECYALETFYSFGITRNQELLQALICALTYLWGMHEMTPQPLMHRDIRCPIL
ncbi:uncharacterized protein OCT59_015096 [Rhizophagus irregularis]|uniref:uncharacterized protein n=1 Tax=Rhizophagus irregularis TaxID=588596 RepID=UPI00331C27D6|nr:hypothetical protein OCT59_015096 [Rhizophagus irregularis]